MAGGRVVREALLAGVVVLAFAGGLARAADDAMPVKAPAALSSFDWTGFYVGGHFGYAGGTSNWTADTVAGPGPSASGSLDLFVPFDPFTEAGSYFAGLQAGPNRIPPNRLVLGAGGDVAFPGFPDRRGV